MHGGSVGRLGAALLVVALVPAAPARAQTRAETERAVRLVADGVLRDATFTKRFFYANVACGIVSVCTYFSNILSCPRRSLR